MAAREAGVWHRISLALAVVVVGAAHGAAAQSEVPVVSHSFAFLLSEIFVVGFTDSRMHGFSSWSFSEQLKNSPLEISCFLWVGVLCLASRGYNSISALFCPCYGVCVVSLPWN